MKSIIITVILLIPILTMAQETPANKLFEKYSGQEGYTSVYITKYMFELFSKVSNDEEDKEFQEVTSKLTAIKILTVDSAVDARQNGSFEKEMLETLHKSEYKDMMVVKEGKQTIKFLINEQNGKISEFLMIVSGEDDPVLIFLAGDIDLKNISKLSKTMNIEGLEHLDKVDDKK